MKPISETISSYGLNDPTVRAFMNACKSTFEFRKNDSISLTQFYDDFDSSSVHDDVTASAANAMFIESVPKQILNYLIVEYDARDTRASRESGLQESDIDLLIAIADMAVYLHEQEQN